MSTGDPVPTCLRRSIGSSMPANGLPAPEFGTRPFVLRHPVAVGHSLSKLSGRMTVETDSRKPPEVATSTDRSRTVDRRLDLYRVYRGQVEHDGFGDLQGRHEGYF